MVSLPSFQSPSYSQQNHKTTVPLLYATSILSWNHQPRFHFPLILLEEQAGLHSD